MPEAIRRGLKRLALLAACGLTPVCAWAQADHPADARQEASAAAQDDAADKVKGDNAACDGGDMAACNALGHAYHDGRGVAQNRPIAAVLFEQACDGGIAEACGSLAVMYDSNDGVLGDGASTLRLAKTACDNGNSDGCMVLARLYIYRDPPDELSAYGAKLLDRLCLEDNRRDACELALAKADQPDAALLYRYQYHGCIALSADACREAGNMAEAGHGTPRDHDVAVKLFDRAMYQYEQECTAGMDGSCAALAGALAKGDIRPPDKARAAQLYDGLCKGGDVPSCERRDELAAVVPDLPIPQAGENYIAPGAPERFWHTPAGYRHATQNAPSTSTECHENVTEFRGATYTDKICPPARLLRSIRGRPLTGGQAPWQALLWRPAARAFSPQAQMLCGGALIAKGWILTAAHCVKDSGASIATGGYEVRLGVSNPQDVTQGVSYPIESVYPYKGYDADRHAYDIALVQYDPTKWKQVGETNAIRTIALDKAPVNGRRFPDQANAFAYGWGWTAARHSQSTDVLRSVQLQVDNQPACRAYTKKATLSLGDIVLCAKGKEGRQVCKGDSGGPLVYYQDPDQVPKLIGVVNATWACGTTEGFEQGLFARVAAPEIKSWIEKHVGRGPRRPPPRKRR